MVRGFSALAVVCLLGVCVTAGAQDAPLKVHTQQGTVEGFRTAGGKVRGFKGIAYAAAPVGPLRWQEPQPAPRIDGTFKALEYGNHCAQTNSFADMIYHEPASEDCLTLNIWTPAHVKPGAALPVMFWIHGGGYYAGGSSEGRHDGEFLAQHNVIVVTINYRLGIFGFFVHPELAAESKHHAAGNYGLLDQVQALKWVHDNAAAFGGDPGNVTIFGESAGSFAVSALMASPLSRGLFAKAIGESGGALGSATLPEYGLAEREAADSAFARTAYNTTSLADLRKLSTEAVLSGVASTKVHFNPDVDGYFLPKPVAAIYAAGEQAQVPLIAGWNADEMRAAVLLNPVKPTAESFKANAEKDYGEAAPEFLKLYPAATDAEAITAAGDLVSDRFIDYSTWKWLEVHTQTGHSKTYRYLFALPAPTDKFHPVATGTFHSDDIEYVFGTLDSRQQAKLTPADRTMSDVIQRYWTNFARSGDPNGEGLPAWPVYKPTDYQVLKLDSTTRAAADTTRARYLFHDTHPLAPAKP